MPAVPSANVVARFSGCVGQYDLAASKIAGTGAFGGATDADAGERHRTGTGAPSHERPTTVQWLERTCSDLEKRRGDLGRWGC